MVGGLIEADTTIDYTAKINKIENDYTETVGSYLTDKIIPCIKEHIIKVQLYT